MRTLSQVSTIWSFRGVFCEVCAELLQGAVFMGLVWGHHYSLGAPVVPFYPFSFWVPLLKPNSRKKGTLIIKGLLGNLVLGWDPMARLRDEAQAARKTLRQAA